METPPWYVLTGGPCAGKTTLIEEFKRRGHNVLPEAAQIVLLEQLALGRTVEELGNSTDWFGAIVERKFAMERAVPPEELFFFDRGVPDSLAYYKFRDLPIDTFLRDAVAASTYRKIFLLDLIEFESNGIRVESPEEARVLHEMLRKTYKDLGYEIQQVPVLPIAERADYILAHL